jgi:hypothetical protein
MIQRRFTPGLLMAAVLALTIVSGGTVDAQRGGERKPSVSLRASPPVGISPLRVRLTAELRGGDDDFADFYCPTIEWDFGDDAMSGSSGDCEPFKPGVSQIQRRYTTEHVFRYFGDDRYTIRFTMKQGSRVVASTTTNVTVRGSLQDDFD